MSAENLHTERDEHITQAEILNRLVQIQDELYLVRRTLDVILVQMAEQPLQGGPQETAAVPIDYNTRQN